MFSKIMDRTRKGHLVMKDDTICEVHRIIYDILVLELAESRPDVIRKLVPYIEKAFVLGVKMNKKLCENKLDNLVEWPAGDFKTALAQRWKRVKLVNMIEDNEKTISKFERNPNEVVCNL